MINLNDETFNEYIKEGITLVDFHAEWCGPCKMMMPVFDQLEGELDIKLAKVDIDHAADVTKKYNILTVPTLLIFENGELLNQHIGFAAKQQILDFINSSI